MIKDFMTGLIKQYVADYLDNFDARQIDFSLLKGLIKLEKLQLNNKILDNSPMPLKLKYGRIGLLQI